MWPLVDNHETRIKPKTLGHSLAFTYRERHKGRHAQQLKPPATKPQNHRAPRRGILDAPITPIKSRIDRAHALIVCIRVTNGHAHAHWHAGTRSPIDHATIPIDLEGGRAGFRGEGRGPLTHSQNFHKNFLTKVTSQWRKALL